MSTQNVRSIKGDGVDCENKPAAWYDNISTNYYYEDAVNGTNADNSLNTVLINFLVPDGFVATLNISEFKVDDWGHLTIYPKGETSNKLLHLGMDEGIDGSPGERGGHTEWGKTGKVQLIPGEYVIEVEQKNATYNDKGDPRYNVSKCTLSLHAEKEEAECIFAWPQGASLGTPITWYELNTRPSDGIQRRWNSGTISSVTAEQFQQMAKIIYAEAAPAGQYTIEEMRGIASVMLNRMGNSKSSAYRSGSVIKDITEEFSDPNNWASIEGNLYKSIENTDAHELTNASCVKIKDSINALLYVLENGAIFQWDRFVAANSSNRNDSNNYVIVGGTAFKTTQVYYKDCKTKPANWDSLPIDKNGPLAAHATDDDVVS